MRKIKEKLKEFFGRIWNRILPVFAFRAKKSVLIFSLIILVLSSIFLIARPVQAGFIHDALSTIFEGIARFSGLLVIGVIRLIVSFAQYNNFLKTPAVLKGWEILRDLTNMFFILVFLVIAFATVLNIEKYSYKRLLLPLLMMALLVNFSLTICGLVIDFAQVIMLTFINAIKDIAPGNLAQILGIKEVVTITTEAGMKIEQPTGLKGWDLVLAWILAAVMMFIALVVCLLILVLLIFRIVALWILIILSPLAFIFYVLPGTKSYADIWQKKFVNQVIVGPVLAFFLWFAFYAVQQGNITPSGMNLQGLEEEGLAITKSEAGKPNFLASFSIGIGMLIGALLAAKQLGVAGASLAGKGTEFFQRTLHKGTNWIRNRLEGIKGRTMDALRPFTTDLAATLLRTPLAGITKGGKGVTELWGKWWAEKAIVSPIPAFVKSMTAKFGMPKGGPDLLTTKGVDRLREVVSEEDQDKLKGLMGRYKAQGGLTEDQKKEFKDIIKGSGLIEDEKRKFESMVDKDIKTIERLDEKSATEKFNKEIVEVLKEILTRKGLTSEEVGAHLTQFQESEIATIIKDIIKNGGAPQENVKILINEFIGNLSNRRLPGAAVLPAHRSFTDKEKEIIEEALFKSIPVFTPLSEEEYTRVYSGLRGKSEHTIDEVLETHKDDKNLPDIERVLRAIIALLQRYLDAGQISLTDRRKVKEDIERQIDQLIKENKLSDQEGAMVKTKLLAQVELIPAKTITKKELWGQILKDAGKWAGEKLTLPLTYAAATLEALPDIPIFDIDALLKDIQNFNARRTRKREADRLGKLHDLMNLWVSWGKDITDFKGNEIMRRVLEEKQEVQNKTMGETHATLHELYSSLKGNDMPRANAALMILAENNDLNEIFKGDWAEKFFPYLKKFLVQDLLGKKIEILNEKTGKMESIKITHGKIEEIIRTAKTKGDVNPVFMREMVKNVSLIAAKDEAVAAKIANTIGMITLQHGAPHMGYAVSRFNSITGKMEFSPFRIYIDEKGMLDITLSEQTINEVVGKVKNISQRIMYQRAHPGMFGTEDMYGNIKGMNPLNIAFLVNAEPTFFSRPYEMRGDVLSKLNASLEFQRDFENLLTRMIAEPYKFISPFLPTIKDVLNQIEAMRQYMAVIKRAHLEVK